MFSRRRRRGGPAHGPGAIFADRLLIWGIEGAIRFGAFECLREILYNVYWARVSRAFELLAVGVSARSTHRVPMSDEAR